MTAATGVRLSVGAVRAGWYSLDNRAGNGADCVHDLEAYPWPLPDGCAVQVFVGHAANRVNPARFGFLRFMNEVHRVTAAGGELTLACYCGANARYQADPAACNVITETTLRYFDPDHESGLWRIYQPQPWRVVHVSWAVDGNLEAVLEKR